MKGDSRMPAHVAREREGDLDLPMTAGGRHLDECAERVGCTETWMRRFAAEKGGRIGAVNATAIVSAAP